MTGRASQIIITSLKENEQEISTLMPKIHSMCLSAKRQSSKLVKSG